MIYRCDRCKKIIGQPGCCKDCSRFPVPTFTLTRAGD